MRPTQHRRNPVFRLAIAVAAVLASHADAATWAWDDVTGVWSLADNWNTTTVPVGAADTAVVFGGSGGAGYTSTFDLGTLSLNLLNLQSSATAANVIDGEGVLEFTANGASMPAIAQKGSGAFTISTHISAMS